MHVQVVFSLSFLLQFKSINTGGTPTPANTSPSPSQSPGTASPSPSTASPSPATASPSPATTSSSVSAHSISQRVIYTFHPIEKTWNEARNICEDRQGQLVKLESSAQEEEILYLGSNIYPGSIHNNTIWTGSHLNATSGLVYQDCVPSTNTTTPTTTPAPDTVCVGVDRLGPNGFYSYEHCSSPRKFICQRTIGDCWFRPHEDYTVIGDSTQTTLTTTETTICALECRNQRDGNGNECWAFTFDKSTNVCYLHFLGAERFGKAPSVAYLLGDNEYLKPSPDVTLYLRICFEGEVDEELYESYTDTSSNPDSPNQACSKTDPEPANQLCFCESTEDPPIPEPIAIADKIEELVKELTIEPSNTSAALRKKISAEDNRPSAQGVGYMGAGLMGTVFGGLFLLDIQVMIQGIAQIVKVIKGAV